MPLPSWSSSRASTGDSSSPKGVVELYRCQATDALAASEPLRDFHLRQDTWELEDGTWASAAFQGDAARGRIHGRS